MRTRGTRGGDEGCGERRRGRALTRRRVRRVRQVLAGFDWMVRPAEEFNFTCWRGHPPGLPTSPPGPPPAFLPAAAAACLLAASSPDPHLPHPHRRFGQVQGPGSDYRNTCEYLQLVATDKGFEMTFDASRIGPGSTLARPPPAAASRPLRCAVLCSSVSRRCVALGGGAGLPLCVVLLRR